MLNFTENAKAQLKNILAGQDSSLMGLRVDIIQDNQLEFKVVQLNQLSSNEEPLRNKRTHFFVEYESFLLIVDSNAQKNIIEGTVDYEDGGLLGGTFVYQTKSEDVGLGKLDPNNPLTRQVQDFLNKEINPGLAMHGGFAELLNIQDDKVYLKFGGGCQGCSMIDMTVKQGVETRLKEVFPQLKEIVDYTNHSAGANPYFS